MVQKMVPKIVSKSVPRLVPSIVKKELIFCTEIPFSILKDKSGDKSRDNFGSWYMSENKNCISGQFSGPFWGQFFSSESGSCTSSTLCAHTHRPPVILISFVSINLTGQVNVYLPFS